MTVDAAELFGRELGFARVIARGDDRLGDYAHDESSLGPYLPDAAVLCENVDEVVTTLAVAAAHNIVVTPRGAGTGMTGGCLPVRGGIVLSTERMARIHEVSSEDFVAVTDPGVITGDLAAAADAAGLFYPPDPASLAFCSIGGNAANNAGGPRAFKYGVTRGFVLGLEVVLMGGERLRVGRRTAKGVTGYDLVGSFVGSEGTFGVITELTLGLVPRPRGVSTLLATFSDSHAAARAIQAILHAGHVPRTLEIADRTAIEHVRPHASYRFPANAGAFALIELDGDPNAIATETLVVGALCETNSALEVIVAKDARERRALWETRRIISPSLRSAYPHKVSEDICVPRGSLGEMLRRIDVIAGAINLATAVYGHAGDGNLHVNFLVDEDPTDPRVATRIEQGLVQLFEATIALRGTLSGEHGIGLAKQRFLPLEQSAGVIEWQRKLKALWDPADLLNPGKILPARPRACHE